jgi:hypothetical protein
MPLTAMLRIRSRFRIRIRHQIQPYTINIVRVYAIAIKYLQTKGVNVVLDYIGTGTRYIQYRYDLLRS